MKRLWVAANVSCLALLMGCPMLPEDATEDDDDGSDESGEDGNKPGGSSGVDEQLPLNGLNNDQAMAICDWAETTYSQIDQLFTPEKLCTLLSASYAQTTEECQQAVTECVGSNQFEPPEVDEVDDEDRAECAEELAEITAGCEVSVDELQTCVNDSLALLEEFFSSVSCDALGQPPAEPSDPESCLALEAKCPGLVGEGGDEGPGDDYPGDEYPGDQPAFSCEDGGEIPGDWVCDGDPDCNDGSDEAYCGGVRPSECDVGPEQFCDGTPDCPEGEDELYCDEPPPAPGEELSGAVVSRAQLRVKTYFKLIQR